MKKLETLIKENIINNWNKYFPNYIFVKKEYVINWVWRVDIFARDVNTLRPVIIEIKTRNKNPTQQLLAYQYSYYEENPILIWINEKYNRKLHIFRDIFFYEIDIHKNELILKKEWVNKRNSFDMNIFMDDELYFEKYIRWNVTWWWNNKKIEF